jgi:cysteine desulfurase/selenocysteine lyase
MTLHIDTIAKDSLPPLLNVERIREDFPALHQQIRGKQLVYLDNAATAQKPRAVIDAMSGYYERSNANVHRGVHTLSERATQAYENARDKVRRFLNAADCREIVFVRGTTEGINLVAQSFARPRLSAGDEILVTLLEHHSNIVPWQLVCQQTGAVLRVVPINDDGELVYDEFVKLFSERSRLFAVAHMSNALGTINPIKQMIEVAHAHGVPVVVDGAQAVPHLNVDVQALECDFYTFSGHKLYGPSGIGVLYGKLPHLKEMVPYQGGGEMIRKVTFEETLYAEPPYKFEAGTPHIAGVIGLGEAIDYMNSLGLETVAQHENDLLDYATEAVAEVGGLRLIGTAREKAGILSFVLKGIHAHDIGTIMDHEGIAVRAGHLCAMPVMHRFGIAATARASFAMYNTRQEVDALVAGLHKVNEVMGR